MVTKRRSGSERAKTGSGFYLASEQTKRSGQGAFASHPKGMALPPPDRRRNARAGPTGPPFALLLVHHPAGAMSRLSLEVCLDPEQMTQ